jgi:SAM-dependent methyltransferase
MNTDAEWQKWGRQDPYFAVITNEKFRSTHLTEEAKHEFFESGHVHIAYVLEHCRRLVGGPFSIRRALDFGCGVGRLCVPLSEHAESVVGVDVSADMLEEAKRNCVRYGCTNVTFRISDNTLSEVDGTFDLVHSFITFQHIDVERGKRLFAELIARIMPGGLGAIHVTYGKAQFAETWGQPPRRDAASVVVESQPAIDVPRKEGLWTALLALMGLNTVSARPATTPRNGLPATSNAEQPPESEEADPQMAMNPYHLGEIAFALQSAGIPAFHAEFTDHGGELGVFLFFRKPA